MTEGRLTRREDGGLGLSEDGELDWRRLTSDYHNVSKLHPFFAPRQVLTEDQKQRLKKQNSRSDSILDVSSSGDAEITQWASYQHQPGCFLNC